MTIREQIATLPILCAYLPYGVEMINTAVNRKYTLEFGHLKHLEDKIQRSETNNKLLLRPLSSLTKPITHNGETFVPVEWLEDKYYTLDLHKQVERLLEEDGHNWINQSDYMLVEHLIEWHFDVFGGIEAGWALPIEEDGK